MNWIDRLGAPGGVPGGTFAALCCTGAPAAVGLLAAVGAGFLLNDLVLLPLLAVALGVAIWALQRGAPRRNDGRPLWLGLAASVAMVLGIFAGPGLIWPGAGLLVVASMWNVLPSARAAREAKEERCATSMRLRTATRLAPETGTERTAHMET